MNANKIGLFLSYRLPVLAQPLFLLFGAPILELMISKEFAIASHLGNVIRAQQLRIANDQFSLIILLLIVCNANLRNYLFTQ